MRGEGGNQIRGSHSKLRVTGWLLLLIIGGLGCSVLHYRVFQPVERERPIILFDRYVMHVDAFASTNNNMLISFWYLTEITDTLHLDTLPILVLDSVCLSGHCLDSSFCVPPVSWADLRGVEAGVFYFDDPKPIDPFYDDDLFYFDGKVVPGGYEVSRAYHIPATCTDTAVTVEYQARLLDRETGRTLAAETKRVQFRITPKKKRYMSQQEPASQTQPVAACPAACDGQTRLLNLLPTPALGHRAKGTVQGTVRVVDVFQDPTASWGLPDWPF